MVMNLCMWSPPYHMNLHAKNEQYLFSGFGDRAIATAWQPKAEGGPRGVDDM